MKRGHYLIGYYAFAMLAGILAYESGLTIIEAIGLLSCTFLSVLCYINSHR